MEKGTNMTLAQMIANGKVFKHAPIEQVQASLRDVARLVDTALQQRAA